MKIDKSFKHLILVFTLLVVTSVAMGKNKTLCTAEPKECSYQIRTMLAGKRYLGVKVEESQSGLNITRVVAESPAERGGMRVGDRIIMVNDRDCAKSTVKQFKELVNATPVSGRISFVIARNGYFLKLQAKFEVLNESQMKRVIETHLREAHADPTVKSKTPEKQRDAREKRK